jgi:threonine dehydrogenase-like Zn-dependent dehydrogenase
VTPRSARFVDAEWAAAPGVAPAIVASDPETAAAALAAVARNAVAVAPGEAVEVTGSGLVAAEARRLLALEGRLAVDGHAAPDAIVETTGDPTAIVDATARVAYMGTIALAGESLDRRLRLDVYPDVHVRGLRLVGVPGAGDGDGAEPPPDCLASLRDAGSDDAAARWYRLERST